MSPVSHLADPNVPPTAPAVPRRKIVLLAALLVLATLISYLNSLTAPFIFDDQNWIVHYRQLRSLPADLGKLRVTDRPLVHLSVALNYALGQLDVRSYHVFNLAVHMIAGLALFGIVRWTVQLSNQRSQRNLPATSISFAVALLWLVHPLQTGSVTYVIQRCESMMGMFFLLCLYGVIRGSQSRRGWLWYVASIVACVLGPGLQGGHGDRAARGVAVRQGVSLPFLARVVPAARLGPCSAVGVRPSVVGVHASCHSRWSRGRGGLCIPAGESP